MSVFTCDFGIGTLGLAPGRSIFNQGEVCRGNECTIYAMQHDKNRAGTLTWGGPNLAHELGHTLGLYHVLADNDGTGIGANGFPNGSGNALDQLGNLVTPNVWCGLPDRPGFYPLLPGLPRGSIHGVGFSARGMGFSASIHIDPMNTFDIMTYCGKKEIIPSGNVWEYTGQWISLFTYGALLDRLGL